jgi:antitoxin PrlF
MALTWMRARGQLTIPAEIRKAARLEEGDPIEVKMVSDGILLRPKKVIDATQAWFWTPAWQAGEREASKEVRARVGTAYESDEDFLRSLEEDS